LDNKVKLLTKAPLPSWSSLINVFGHHHHNLDTLSSEWCREGDVAGWFSRSAWSFVRVALWRQKYSKSKNIIIWFPDYFCNSSLTPLRFLNTNLIFYPINQNLEPDHQACRELAKTNPPDIFVLVHYFGCPTNASSVKEFCSKHHAWLLEDAAHVLRPIPGVGKYGDFIIYSPHKLLPIPDGAVLIIRRGGPGEFNAENLRNFGPNTSWIKDFSSIEKLKKVPVRNSIWYHSEWLFKRIFQKLGFGLKHKLSEFIETGVEFSKANELIKPEFSQLSRLILGYLKSSFADVVRWRKSHQLLWDYLLNEESNLNHILPASRPQQHEWTPYLAAFASKNENDAKKIFELLGNRGLPVSTWPDLAPEVITNRKIHKIAWELRHRRYYLPLHQSLKSKDLLGAVFNISRVKKVNGLNQLELKKNISREYWNSLMTNVGRSNLLQSWAYGEAKSKIENLKVLRIVVMEFNKPIAFVQILEKKFALFRLVRINRGPLFLEGYSPELQEQVIQFLVKELGGWKKGRLISFTPELPLNGRFIALMAKLGLYQFNCKSWESIWFDLDKDQIELRKRLNGKWRNMLSYAERQKLRLETHFDVQNLEWLLKHCEKIMRERGESIPLKLYHQLLLELESEQPMQIFKAFLDDELLAGICIVSHGTAATYLLGWNGKQGRSLKANQFLLWNAMMILKEQGIRWFDLGGIDEENTPGISGFKLGVNGIRYSLVGDGWK
tara:strand:- start:2011 stop:4179 length:2169 start_codon:yes stop_codon:yes gene_type:complete